MKTKKEIIKLYNELLKLRNLSNDDYERKIYNAKIDIIEQILNI